MLNINHSVCDCVCVCVEEQANSKSIRCHPACPLVCRVTRETETGHGDKRKAACDTEYIRRREFKPLKHDAYR